MSIGLFARQGKSSKIRQTDTVGGRRVLPRFFRKPVRSANRLLSGNFNVSKRSWFILVLGIAIMGTAGIVANSRQSHSLVAQATAAMGFTIDGVVVEGIDEVSKNDILARIDVGVSESGMAKSLFSFDAGVAREEIAKLAWVKDVVVGKSYPNRLIIRINERTPYAIWQNDNALFLVERGGQTIDRFDERFSALPLLVGKGANVDGADIIYLTGKVDILKGQVKAYVRLGERRWDLRLKNGITVRLPGENPAAALEELARLDKAHDLLSRDIKSVDLRLTDRIIVALSDEALQVFEQKTDNSSAPVRTGISSATNLAEKKI